MCTKPSSSISKSYRPIFFGLVSWWLVERRFRQPPKLARKAGSAPLEGVESLEAFRWGAVNLAVLATLPGGVPDVLGSFDPEGFVSNALLATGLGMTGVVVAEPPDFSAMN